MSDDNALRLQQLLERQQREIEEQRKKEADKRRTAEDNMLALAIKNSLKEQLTINYGEISGGGSDEDSIILYWMDDKGITYDMCKLIGIDNQGEFDTAMHLLLQKLSLSEEGGYINPHFRLLLRAKDSYSAVEKHKRVFEVLYGKFLKIKKKKPYRQQFTTFLTITNTHCNTNTHGNTKMNPNNKFKQYVKINL